LKNQELTDQAMTEAERAQGLADLRALHGPAVINAMMTEGPQFFAAALVADPDPGGEIREEGWTTHADGAQTFYDPELSDAIEDSVCKALAPRFAAVQSGAPGYYWFAEDRADGTEALVVRRVVRDGSEGLWTDDGWHGVPLTSGVMAACLGPVAPYAKAAPAPSTDRAQVREALAAHAHAVWARWMAWQGEHARLMPLEDFGADGVAHVDAVRRWARQQGTPYAALSEAEKASDRAIADEYLAILDGGTP
jgi:hypothetical protein